MANDRFNSIWEPRVGAEAAGLLRKRAWLALGGAGLLALIAVTAITTSGSRYFVIVLSIIAPYVGVHFWMLRSINRRTAAALTAHLGVPISARTVPPVRSAEQFDRAVEVLRGTRAVHQQSFLGGFVRVRRPSPR